MAECNTATTTRPQKKNHVFRINIALELKIAMVENCVLNSFITGPQTHTRGLPNFDRYEFPKNIAFSFPKHGNTELRFMLR